MPFLITSGCRKAGQVGKDRFPQGQGESGMGKNFKGLLDQMAGMERRRKHMLFLLLTLLLSLAYLPILKEVFNLSLSSEMYSHLVLIPFVSAYLVFLRREEAFSRPYRSIHSLEWILTLSASVLLISGVLLPDLTLSAASWVFFLWIGFLLIYGYDSSRTLLFPLFFLIFIAPAPGFLLDWIIGILLWGSDQVTALLFSLTGIPFLHDNYVYKLPRLSIYIAPECSGIRSSTALLLTALLADYLILTRWWSRGILLLSVLPLAVLKNGIRIVTLSLLAIYVDPGFMHGPLHRRGGFIFFGITLLLMGCLLLLLKKLEQSREKKRQEPTP